MKSLRGTAARQSWPPLQGPLAPRVPLEEVHVGQNGPGPKKIPHLSQSLAGNSLGRAWPPLKHHSISPRHDSWKLSGNCIPGRVSHCFLDGDPYHSPSWLPEEHIQITDLQGCPGIHLRIWGLKWHTWKRLFPVALMPCGCIRNQNKASKGTVSTGKILLQSIVLNVASFTKTLRGSNINTEMKSSGVTEIVSFKAGFESLDIMKHLWYSLERPFTPINSEEIGSDDNGQVFVKGSCWRKSQVWLTRRCLLHNEQVIW